MVTIGYWKVKFAVLAGKEPSTSGYIHSKSLATVRYGPTNLTRRSRLAPAAIYYYRDDIFDYSPEPTKLRTTRAPWACPWAPTNALDLQRTRYSHLAARNVNLVRGYFEVNTTLACLRVSLVFPSI
ncbi:hypothetical protein TrVFT333_009781 [Trichoderma virens FT-333]|nr:hypothetical protein TrVFT333_009781 [Trichoderma virens FT-333]